MRRAHGGGGAKHGHGLVDGYGELYAGRFFITNRVIHHVANAHAFVVGTAENDGGKGLTVPDLNLFTADFDTAGAAGKDKFIRRINASGQRGRSGLTVLSFKLFNVFSCERKHTVIPAVLLDRMGSHLNRFVQLSNRQRKGVRTIGVRYEFNVFFCGSGFLAGADKQLVIARAAHGDGGAVSAAFGSQHTIDHLEHAGIGFNRQVVGAIRQNNHDLFSAFALEGQLAVIPGILLDGVSRNRNRNVQLCQREGESIRAFCVCHIFNVGFRSGSVFAGAQEQLVITRAAHGDGRAVSAVLGGQHAAHDLEHIGAGFHSHIVAAIRHGLHSAFALEGQRTVVPAVLLDGMGGNRNGRIQRFHREGEGVRAVDIFHAVNVLFGGSGFFASADKQLVIAGAAQRNGRSVRAILHSQQAADNFEHAGIGFDSYMVLAIFQHCGIFRHRGAHAQQHQHREHKGNQFLHHGYSPPLIFREAESMNIVRSYHIFFLAE